jgi:hypothetical protein
LVAAWHLDSLDLLFPAGIELAALQQPLQPNTLVLQFGGASYLCPPPMQQQPAGLGYQQTSPYKRASSQAAAVPYERSDSAAGAPAGATRRFANLLVSKLLRSAPNLQEAGRLGLNGPELLLDSSTSDGESEAASDVTAVTTAAATTPGSHDRLAAAEGAPGRAGIAAAAGTAAGAKGTPAGGGSTVGAKTLTLAGTYQYITSLAALQGRLRDLVGRSRALQQQLAEALGPEAVRQRQQQQLRDAALEAERCRQRAAEVRGEAAEVQAEAAAAKKQATVRAQALVTTLKVMQASSRRMG